MTNTTLAHENNTDILDKAIMVLIPLPLFAIRYEINYH